MANGLKAGVPWIMCKQEDAPDPVSPARSIEILQDMNVSRVKLYDAVHEILNLLSGIEVAITVTNDEISGIAANQRLADQWVYEHIIAHHPNTKIRFVLVRDEVFSSISSDQDIQIAHHLVPAIRRIKDTIKARGIRNIWFVFSCHRVKGNHVKGNQAYPLVVYLILIDCILALKQLICIMLIISILGV
ncbi:putative glucan endo-1,3-beta-D-glucosidase [Helianthus anomalus]